MSVALESLSLPRSNAFFGNVGRKPSMQQICLGRNLGKNLGGCIFCNQAPKIVDRLFFFNHLDGRLLFIRCAHWRWEEFHQASSTSSANVGHVGGRY